MARLSTFTAVILLAVFVPSGSASPPIVLASLLRPLASSTLLVRLLRAFSAPSAASAVHEPTLLCGLLCQGLSE